MRQLFLVLGLLGVSCALAVGSAGCSNSCDELSARCDNCLDADYRADCRAVADAQIQNTCSKRQALFDAYCPDISELFEDATVSTSGSGGAGGMSTTTTTSSAGGPTSVGGATAAGGATSAGGSGGTAGAGGV